MKQIIFMNHRIRQAKPSGPVIVCLRSDGSRLESNCFTLRAGNVVVGRIVFEPKGLKECKTHKVRAWVELNGAVEAIPDAEIVEQALVKSPRPFSCKPRIPLRKQARAKKPNQQISLD